jgi:hypothetical protein
MVVVCVCVCVYVCVCVCVVLCGVFVSFCAVCLFRNVRVSRCEGMLIE